MHVPITGMDFEIMEDEALIEINWWKNWVKQNS